MEQKLTIILVCLLTGLVLLLIFGVGFRLVQWLVSHRGRKSSGTDRRRQ